MEEIKIPEKVAITNDTLHPKYAGPFLIPPGETRHFNAADLPPSMRPQPAGAAAEVVEVPYDPVAELSEHSVKDIKAALADLTDDDLEQLGSLEQLKGDHARKGVLAAIAEETLARADRRLGVPEAGEAA